MKRISLTPRPDWQSKVESEGLTFHTLESAGGNIPARQYWNESAAYEFSSAEVDMLEAAANNMQTMCLAAAQHVIDNKRYAELAIPAAAVPMIEWAWNAEPPALYGRFDFLYNGSQPPKLLEYNADTPTSLLEAAVVQWHWLEDVADSLPSEHHFLPFSTSKPDQFNSIHERLIAKWKDVADYLTPPLYFAALDLTEGNIDQAEDLLTTTYLRDTANQAGLQTLPIALQDIGWNPERLCFVDLEDNQISSIFKLYPWEAMLSEEFGPHALESYHQTTWIEPIWKLLLSNKGILPILWELYPNHPLLLEAHFEAPAPSQWKPVNEGGPRLLPTASFASTSALSAPGAGPLSAYVRKPMFSREGANISIVRPNSQTIETPGIYGEGPFIRQAIAPPATFDDANGKPRFPVLGLWMIDQDCSGLGIRESAGPITDNLSSFLPHFFTQGI